MNFFAHYYFDNKTGADFNTGLILPDLIRNFVNERIPFPKLIIDNNTSENNILNGCLVHVKRDKEFHQSDFFLQSNKQLIDIIKDKGYANLLPRYWFLSHIMIELCLDAVLIEKDLDLLTRFYKDLEETKNNPAFLVFLSFLDDEKIELFMSRFGRFLEARYLFSYTDSSKLAFALNMISKRAGIVGDYSITQAEIVSNLSQNAKSLVLENFHLLNKSPFEP